VPEIAARAHAEIAEQDGGPPPWKDAGGFSYCKTSMASPHNSGPGLIGRGWWAIDETGQGDCASGRQAVHLRSPSGGPSLSPKARGAFALRRNLLPAGVGAGIAQFPGRCVGLGQYKRPRVDIDDAVGEAFEQDGQNCIRPRFNPGGPACEQLAKSGDPKAFNFPRPAD